MLHNVVALLANDQSLMVWQTLAGHSEEYTRKVKADDNTSRTVISSQPKT